MNRLLLDTHTFLWWDSAPQRLSATILALCRDPSVVLYLSLVSLWEIQIKSSVGKLPLPLPLAEIVREQLLDALNCEVGNYLVSTAYITKRENIFLV